MVWLLISLFSPCSSHYELFFHPVWYQCWLLLDLQHPSSLACLAQGIVTPLSSLVIDPPVSLFTFTVKYKIRGFRVNKGTRAGFPGYLMILFSSVHYFPLKRLICVLSVSTQQFVFCKVIHLCHFNEKKILVWLFSYLKKSLWSPFCFGKPVYFSSLTINTNKIHTNPLGENKLLRDADSSHTVRLAHVYYHSSHCSSGYKLMQQLNWRHSVHLVWLYLGCWCTIFTLDFFFTS